MMKSKITVLLLLFIWSFGLAQNKAIDSLKYQLAIAKNDTSRVLIMYELSNSYSMTKLDSAMKYGRQALGFAQQIKFPKGEAMALINIGLCYRESGELPKALGFVLQGLRIAEDYQYANVIGASYSRLGTIYFDLMEYSKAIRYNQQAILIYKKLQNQNSLIGQYINIGAAYIKNKQLDSGKYFIQLAYDETIEANKIERLQAIFRNLGRIEVESGKTTLGLDYFKQSIQAALLFNDHRNTSLNYNETARLFQEMNQLDSCILYAKKGLEYAQIGPYSIRILESSTLLAEAHKSKNDFKQAYEYQEIMIKAKESLFGAGNIQAMQTMIADDEARRKEVENERILNQNRLKQYGLIVGLGIMFLVGFILLLNNLQKQKANAVLQLEKEKVERTLKELVSTQSQLIQSEKMASLGELTAGIAHEIQNPLNFVNNFSEVNTELIKEIQDERRKTQDARDEELQKELLQDIAQNQEKINHHGKRASDIVKGMLQHSRASSGQKELTDINALVDEYLRLAYHGLRAKDKSFNATMKTEFDVSIGNINVVPQDMGRVILNLITNAFYVVTEKKQKSPEGYEPTVTVSTKKLNGIVEIKVKDNGNGIPKKVLDKIFQPFFTTKPTGQGTGLGLSMSYDIVKAHGGEIKVDTKENEGTEFIIKLPMQ